LETVAVYWEPIIKTYGFQEKTDLSLFRILITCDQMADWGLQFQNIGSGDGRFLMATARMVGAETLQLQLLFEKNAADRYRHELESLTENNLQTTLSIDAPVELICFHGPHFGDRYGIADAAFGALAPKKILVLAAACTGASIYIVVPEKSARTAVEILSKKFIGPQPEKKLV